MNVIRLMTLRQLRAEKTHTVLTLLEITIASGLLTAVLLGGLSFVQSIDPNSNRENELIPLVYAAAALVSVLLLFSAAFLIRSAFAVSFSQRVRALAQLAGIGATRRQLRASVWWEAALLGAVAIPAGMAFSALGLFITFSVMNSFEAVVRLTGPLRLSVSVPGLLFCAAWCALMLFFAACGPAVRLCARGAVLFRVRQYFCIFPKKCDLSSCCAPGLGAARGRLPAGAGARAENACAAVHCRYAARADVGYAAGDGLPASGRRPVCGRYGGCSPAAFA